MADEENKFYPFKFKKKDEDRPQRLEKLKERFNLQRVLQLIEKGELTNEDTAESVNAKIRQLEAIENKEAFQQNMDKEKEKLAKDLQEVTGKEVDKNKLLQETEELAGKEGGFEQRYQEYLERQKQLQDEIKELNQQGKNSQQQSEELARLEHDNKENTDKHNKLEAIRNAAIDCERAEFFADLPKETQENLTEFAKACADKNRLNSEENSIGFKEVFDDLRCDSINHGDEYRSFAPRKNENGKIENNHRFKLDDKGLIRHEIRNLGGTDLDICIVNGEFSFLKNQDLSEEQLKTLAEYCCKNGFEIENGAALKNLKVRNSDGAETGTVDARLQEEMERRYNAERGQMNTPQQSTEVSPVQEPEPQASDREDICQFIPNQKPIKMDRKKVTDKAHARIGMFAGLSDPTLRRVTRYGNSTIISVYASEEDMRIDGERDKNGKRVHSKQFSVELDFSVPPKPRFYMGNVKEFKCDHARLMLDPYKEAGYKYFMIPPVTEIGGKIAGGAFMEASVKTQMVPYLKRTKGGKGCEIGVPDVETIFKKMPEEGEMKGNAKAEYMMRWHRELKAYNKYRNDIGKPNSNLQLFETQFKVGAVFVNFQSTYLENMQKHMQKGMNGELEGGKTWDTVDQITATKAMSKILKEMMDGKLNGKIYNPLGNNEQELIKTLELYMKNERPNVEQQIEKNIQTAAENDPKGMEGKVNPAVRTVQGNADQELRNICTELKGYAVEIDPKIPKAQEDYRRGKTTSNTNLNKNGNQATVAMGGR